MAVRRTVRAGPVTCRTVPGALGTAVRRSTVAGSPVGCGPVGCGPVGRATLAGRSAAVLGRRLHDGPLGRGGRTTPGGAGSGGALAGDCRTHGLRAGRGLARRSGPGGRLAEL